MTTGGALVNVDTDIVVVKRESVDAHLTEIRLSLLNFATASLWSVGATRLNHLVLANFGAESDSLLVTLAIPIVATTRSTGCALRRGCLGSLRRFEFRRC